MALGSVEPIAYQWRFRGTNMLNATDALLTVTNVQPSQAGLYTVQVSDALGAIVSNPAHLTVLHPPEMVEPIPPLHLTVAPGETVTLSAAVRGPTPILALWRQFKFNGAYAGIVANQFVNANVAFLVLTNIGTNMSGIYTLSLTNVVGGTLTTLFTNAVVTVLSDRDGDGLPDDWEGAQRLDPEDAGDGDADSDGDEMSNREEYLAGTDPHDPQSYLKVEATRLDQGVSGARLRFVAVSNRTYTLQWRDGADSGPWNRLADVLAAANNRFVEITDAMAAIPASRRFYRLITPRTP